MTGGHLKDDRFGCSRKSSLCFDIVGYSGNSPYIDFKSFVCDDKLAVSIHIGRIQLYGRTTGAVLSTKDKATLSPISKSLHKPLSADCRSNLLSFITINFLEGLSHSKAIY